MPILTVTSENDDKVFFADYFIASDLYADNIMRYVKEALELAAVYEGVPDEPE